MKKALALFLIFGIFGCAAITYDNQLSHDGVCPKSGEDSAWIWEECTKSNATTIEDIDNFHPKAEAMDNINEEVFFASVFGDLDYAKKSALEVCNFHKKDPRAQCFITRTFEHVYKNPDKPLGGTFVEEKNYYSNAQEFDIWLAEQEVKREREEQARLAEEEYQKQLILTALVDRCSSFGWDTEDNIASCVKQEAYRDLQIQEQEYKMQILEQKLASASYVEEKPFFLEALDILIDEAEKKENRQLRMDIMRLKADTRSLRSQQQTQAALRALYLNTNYRRNNN